MATGDGGRLVAFLRGLNLGNRRLTNDELREAVEGAGLDGVATYQASGNVVFDDPGGSPDAVAQQLAAHLEATLGYPVDTFVRRLYALEEIAGWPAVREAEEEDFKVHVIFVHEPPADAVIRTLESLEGEDDRFRVRSREIYWFRRGRLSDSPIDASNPGALTGGATSTMRTIGTLRRIVKKFGAA